MNSLIASHKYTQNQIMDSSDCLWFEWFAHSFKDRLHLNYIVDIWVLNERISLGKTNYLQLLMSQQNINITRNKTIKYRIESCLGG